MKITIFGLFMLYLMYSCTQKEPISIEEIDSSEIVTITYNEKKQILRIVLIFIFQESLKS